MIFRAVRYYVEDMDDAWLEERAEAQHVCTFFRLDWSKAQVSYDENVSFASGPERLMQVRWSAPKLSEP